MAEQGQRRRASDREPNAADGAQVKAAARAEKRRRERELNDVCEVLAIPGGRRFLWRLMGHCGVNRSIYNDLPQRMSHSSGQQDVGHFVLSEIVEARPEAYLQMMQESAKLEKEDQDAQKTI